MNKVFNSRPQSLDQPTLDDFGTYEAFLDKPLIEAIAIKTKLNRIGSSFGCPEEVPSLTRIFSRSDSIVESYDYLMHYLFNKKTILWKRSDSRKREIISYFLSGTRTLRFYRNLFSLFGEGELIDIYGLLDFAEKQYLHHLTETKNNYTIDVLDEYNLYDLYNIVNPKKVDFIFDSLWKKNAHVFDRMVQKKNGLIVASSNKLKIFQIKKNQSEVSLIYLTPSYIALDPRNGPEPTKRFKFIENKPIRSVCFISSKVSLHRKDFFKVPLGEKMEYTLNVRVPINLYKFSVLRTA